MTWYAWRFDCCRDVTRRGLWTIPLIAILTPCDFDFDYPFFFVYTVAYMPEWMPTFCDLRVASRSM
jgi:hypothetical protein